MIANLKKLEAARAKVAALENAIQNSRLKELSTLPAKYGFADIADFIKALKAAHGAAKVGRGVAASASVKSGKRAKITDEVKNKVAELIQAGKSGSAVAAAVGISLPSVQKIKKDLGLVKARGQGGESPSQEAAPTEQPQADFQA